MALALIEPKWYNMPEDDLGKVIDGNFTIEQAVGVQVLLQSYPNLFAKKKVHSNLVENRIETENSKPISSFRLMSPHRNVF